MPAEKLRIRHVDPRTLTPAPYNPNLMTETARAELRRSLETGQPARKTGGPR